MARSSTDVVNTRVSRREEMAGGDLGDDRLNARRDRLIDVLAQSPDVGFPEACTSDGEVEALYRFLRNPRVSLAAVLEPHLVATQQRCRALDEVLVIHDTTEFSFAGEHVRTGLTALGPRRQGFWVHAALAVSAEGLRAPLGVLSVLPFVRKAAPVRRPKPPWRARFRDPAKLSRRWPASVTAARARVGEAHRAIHLMDREGDSYELLATMVTHGDRFVVRLHYDRRVVPDEAATAPARLREALPRTDVVIEREVALSPRRVGAQRTPLLTRHPPRNGRVATVRFAARQVVLQRPRDHRSPLPATLTVNVVYGWEVDPPPGESPVEWSLVTTEPIDTAAQVLQIVDWYRTRWLIEEFFKCLKTGCAYEKRQLESLDTLLVALALLAPIAWQQLLLRHLARALPDAPARVALTERQLHVLRATPAGGRLPSQPTTRDGLLAVARLGGHLRQNGEPGWLVLGRGMQKLLRMEA
ncbi:MAG: IS4 family transposase, partial [Planctomycetota bacterium]|nr:IS4 family transposase [Planctomycetota bacterium]